MQVGVVEVECGTKVPDCRRPPPDASSLPSHHQPAFPASARCMAWAVLSTDTWEVSNMTQAYWLQFVWTPPISHSFVMDPCHREVLLAELPNF